MLSKVCTQYNISKDLSEFYPDKRVKRADGRDSKCKLCNKQSAHNRRNAKCKTIRGYLTHILYYTRSHCKRINRELSVTVDDLVTLYNKQQGKCALSGVELTCGSGTAKHTLTHVSIDRIDSSGGYTLDNIQLVCYIVNVMKTNLTIQELKQWCKLILNGDDSLYNV